MGKGGKPMEDNYDSSTDFLIRVDVSLERRCFHLYTDQGNYERLDLEGPDEFLGVLTYLRDTVPQDVIHYNQPVVMQ
tara:strand:+ start:1114 stop:1344 length:231 start_codon:yes stop_codon:yes gene_type:complete